MDRYQPNNESAPKLKPVEEQLKLQFNEIGIKSDVKGPEIKRIIDKVVNDLVYRDFEKVILKSRGKACSKLISIVDILRRKILGLHMLQRNYSTAYLTNNDRDRERTIQLPCMDAILQLRKPDTAEGYFPPKNKNELDANYIDPENPPERQEYRGGFRGRGRGIRGYYRGRDNFRGGDNYRGGQYRGRGRGQRGFRGNYSGYYNNRNESNDYNYGMRKYHQTNYHNYNNNNHNFNNSHYNNRNEERGNMHQYNSQTDNNQFQNRRNMNNREDFNNFDREGGGRGRGRGQFYQNNNNQKNYQDDEDDDYSNFKYGDQLLTDNQTNYSGDRGGNERGFAHQNRGRNDQRGGFQQRGDMGNRGGRFMMIRGRGY